MAGKAAEKWVLPRTSRRNQHFHLNPVKHTIDFLLTQSQKMQLPCFKPSNVSNMSWLTNTVIPVFKE